MAGRAAKASKATKSVKKASEALPTRRATTRKGPIKDRAAVAQNGPGRGIVKTRLQNQAHIAALVDPTTLDEWDDEELARGYRKDKNGRFTGRPPVMVPMVVAQEMLRRAQVQGLINLAKLGPKAMRTLEKVMAQTDDPKAQVAAAKLIVERILPAPGRHDVVDHRHSAEPKFLQALQGGIVSTDEDDDDIVDAEIVEAS